MENYIDVLNWMQHCDPSGEYLELLVEDEIPNETLDELVCTLKIWRNDSYEDGKMVHKNQWRACEAARAIIEKYRLSRWSEIIRKEQYHV